MRSFMQLAFKGLLFSSIFALSSPSRADGVALSPGALAAPARSALESEIASARKQRPAAFRAARAVDSFRTKAAAGSRHNQPTAARAFMRLGKAGLMPMLEMLAWKADVTGLTPPERLALGDGLLQAVAFARDPRSAPVLEAVFLRSAEPRFVASAAAGLGMLCGPEQRSLLLGEASVSGPRRAAAIGGLGHCRSLDVAGKLASILSAESDAAVVKLTARSLGYVASSWALATTKLSSAEREAIRSIAAKALGAAYAAHEGQTRVVVARALLMVAHPAAVPALREVERAGEPATKVAATRLRLRLEASPTR